MFVTCDILNNDQFFDTNFTVDNSETSYNLEQKLHDDTKFQQIHKDYYKTLKFYKTYLYNYHKGNFSQDALTYFEKPLEHFVIENQKLKLIQHPMINFEKPATAFSNLQLPNSVGATFEKDLLKHLKRYLNRNALFSCEIINIPSEDLFTMCGNLFGFSPEDIPICLTSSNIKEYFTEILKTPYPKDTKKIKRSIEYCKRHLSHAYEQKELENTSIILVQSQTQHDCYKFEYSKEKKLLCVSSIQQDDDWKYVKECNCISIQSITNPQITPELSNTLYSITQGDFKALCRWSILFANISSCEYITKKIFVISCTHDLNDSICAFFYSIFYNMERDLYYAMPYDNLKDIVSAATTPLLCTYQALGAKYFLINKIEHLYLDEDVKRLKKMILGKPIDYKDKLFGKITYTNNLPIICIVNSQEDLIYLKNNYPCIELGYYGPDSDTDPNTENSLFDPDSYDWLRLKLSLYGLYHIKNVSKNTKTNVDCPTSDCKYIFDEFIELCCQKGPSKTVFTTVTDLHNAYLYFHNHLCSGTSLTKRKFIKKFNLYETFEYKRPHVSRSGGNPYAFMGIKLKDNYKELIDKKTDNRFPSSEASLFFEQLQKIDNKIYFDFK